MGAFAQIKLLTPGLADGVTQLSCHLVHGCFHPRGSGFPWIRAQLGASGRADICSAASAAEPRHLQCIRAQRPWRARVRRLGSSVVTSRLRNKKSTVLRGPVVRSQCHPTRAAEWLQVLARHSKYRVANSATDNATHTIPWRGRRK